MIDFLSMATGADFETDQSYELMARLSHIDERAAEPLANKVRQIPSVERAYKLDQFVREARQREGDAWVLTAGDVGPFIESSENLSQVLSAPEA